MCFTVISTRLPSSSTSHHYPLQAKSSAIITTSFSTPARPTKRVRIADRSPSYFLDDSYDSEASLDDWVIETFGEDSDSEDVDEPQPPPRPPPPAKRQHANSRRPSFPLHYRIMLSIGRRVNNIPRERLYFLLHLVSYSDFHNVFRDFQRIELDKCGKDQLARRGLRRGRSTTRDWLDVSIPVRPAPKSETRELWL